MSRRINKIRKNKAKIILQNFLDNIQCFGYNARHEFKKIVNQLNKLGLPLPKERHDYLSEKAYDVQGDSILQDLADAEELANNSIPTYEY